MNDNKDSDNYFGYGSKMWYELYIELLSNPLDKRSDREFCEEHQIPITTFGAWKRKYRPQIFEEAAKRRKKYVNEIRQAMWKSLAKKMESSKGIDSEKLMAQLLGDLVERTESRVEHMDDNAKMRRINSLLNEIGKRKNAQTEAAKNDPQHETNSASEPLGPGTPELGRNEPPAAS